MAACSFSCVVVLRDGCGEANPKPLRRRFFQACQHGGSLLQPDAGFAAPLGPSLEGATLRPSVACLAVGLSLHTWVDRRRRSRGPFHTSRGAASSEEETLPIKVLPVETRGLGMIATRNISTGEFIVAEKPLLVLPGGGPLWEPSVEASFSDLPRAAKAAIMELPDRTVKSPSDKTLLGVARTNQIPKTACDPISQNVICELIGRFNHSCEPNCEQSWNEELGQVRVFASTYIRAGQELTLPYTDVRAPIVERSRLLLANYGFQCFCPACMESEADADFQRLEMQQFMRRLRNMSETEGPEARRGLDLALDLLDMFDEAMLHPKCIREETCSAGLKFALQANDMDEARRWAQKAYGHSVTCRGKDHPLSKKLKEYTEDPEKSPNAIQNRPEEVIARGYVVFLSVIIAALLFSLTVQIPMEMNKRAEESTPYYRTMAPQR